MRIFQVVNGSDYQPVCGMSALRYAGSDQNRAVTGTKKSSIAPWRYRSECFGVLRGVESWCWRQSSHVAFMRLTAIQVQYGVEWTIKAPWLIHDDDGDMGFDAQELEDGGPEGLVGKAGDQPQELAT